MIEAVTDNAVSKQDYHEFKNLYLVVILHLFIKLEGYLLKTPFHNMTLLDCVFYMTLINIQKEFLKTNYTFAC